jgi:hypothetical protein
MACCGSAKHISTDPGTAGALLFGVSHRVIRWRRIKNIFKSFDAALRLADCSNVKPGLQEFLEGRGAFQSKVIDLGEFQSRWV